MTVLLLRTERDGTERERNDWKNRNQERKDLAEDPGSRTERNDIKKVGTCPALPQVNKLQKLCFASVIQPKGFASGQKEYARKCKALPFHIIYINFVVRILYNTFHSVSLHPARLYNILNGILQISQPGTVGPIKLWKICNFVFSQNKLIFNLQVKLLGVQST